MNVSAITNIGTNNTASTWTPQAGRRVSILDTSNPNFPRNVFLDNVALVLSRPNVTPVILPVTSFLAACAAINPNLTWAPIETTAPSSTNVANPSAVGFVTAYSAEVSITYKWQKSVNAGFTWSNLTDAGVYSNTSTNHLNISNTNTLDNTSYRVLAIDSAGTTEGTVANLRVLPDPSVYIDPQSLSVAAPYGANMNISAVGFTSLSYRWQNSPNGVTYANLGDDTIFNGVNTNALTINISTGLNATYYRCFVSDSAGNDTSNAALLTVT